MLLKTLERACSRSLRTKALDISLTSCRHPAALLPPFDQALAHLNPARLGKLLRMLLEALPPGDAIERIGTHLFDLGFTPQARYLRGVRINHLRGGRHFSSGRRLRHRRHRGHCRDTRNRQVKGGFGRRFCSDGSRRQGRFFDSELLF
jgi:hypothetical protein